VEDEAETHPTAAPWRLVVASNRLPELASPAQLTERKTASVGGLVSALRPALEAAPGALWFGWSGTQVKAGGRPRTHRARLASAAGVGIDLREDEVDGHYNGFCNGALWPLLHGFPGRLVVNAAHHATYRQVNTRFARALSRHLRPGDRVWVHDYHLIPLGAELRRRGFDGPLGFFLHVPFPSHDVLSLLPWAAEVLRDLRAYDVVGFHTPLYAANYEGAIALELGAGGGAPQRVGAYPIGIDPAPLKAWSADAEGLRRGASLRASAPGRQIVLGVDRLDYTKGIPERLRAFERLLELHPRLHRRVTYVQISAPSRTRVAEYIRQRREVEELVGRVNGRFGHPEWVPVRYLFRSFSQRELAAYYREADVCLVSPLRDGMNLVAKEYVACQPDDDPGVLVLSRFAGAAAELKDALIVNPYDLDGTANALARALAMARPERVARQAALLRRVEAQTATRWASSFLADLAASRPARGGGPPPARARSPRARVLT
jgi:trehalose 6-phosphate synthase